MKYLALSTNSLLCVRILWPRNQEGSSTRNFVQYEVRQEINTVD